MVSTLLTHYACLFVHCLKRNSYARLTWYSVYLQLSFETCHRYIQKVINEHMCVTV